MIYVCDVCSFQADIDFNPCESKNLWTSPSWFISVQFCIRRNFFINDYRKKRHRMMFDSLFSKMPWTEFFFSQFNHINSWRNHDGNSRSVNEEQHQRRNAFEIISNNESVNRKWVWLSWRLWPLDQKNQENTWNVKSKASWRHRWQEFDGVHRKMSQSFLKFDVNYDLVKPASRNEDVYKFFIFSMESFQGVYYIRQISWWKIHEIIDHNSDQSQR